MFTTRLFNLLVLATLLIVTACTPTTMAPSATSIPVATATPAKLPVSPDVWSPGLPPNGVWQVELTAEDIMRMGITQPSVKDWVGLWTWTFQNGKAEIDYRGPGGDFTCLANLVLVDNVARLTYYNGDACGNSVDDLQWRLDTYGLHLHRVAIQDSRYIENRALYEAKPWQKVE